MIEIYVLERTLKLERELLTRRHERQAVVLERLPRRSATSISATVRRRLARVLLALANRLDPRGVVSVPHAPSAPALNGTLHHA